MNVNKRMGLYITLGLSVVLVLSVVFLYSPPGKFFRNIIAHAKEERQRSIRLLSETDYQALLEACRKLSREIEHGNLLAPYRYVIRYKPSPEITRFPQVILDIDPMFIDTWTDGRITVGMSGGVHHYGVTAYPENYEKPSVDFKFGDRELIPGLWYYDDGYHEDPEFGKKVDELIKEHKKKK